MTAARTMMKIPYGQHSINEEDIRAVVDVLRNGPLTQGPKIAEFEDAVCRFTGAKYAVAVSSGTAALHLAVLAAGIGPGDTVVTSPNTFVASANCARYAGASVALADIDPDTLNLSPDSLGQVCKKLKRVKAIIAVHFAGLSCDMPLLKAIAGQNAAVLIEDAAHAFGGRYPDDGRIGNCRHSAMTTFSFHPVKIIAAGEGGMVTTNSEDLYRRLIRLRSHGINKGSDTLKHPDLGETIGEPNAWYYEMQELGFNYRMTDIQASLALSQLRRVDSFLDRRRELVKAYDKALEKDARLSLVQRAGRDLSAHHIFVVRIGFDHLKITRATLMRKLRDVGIGTQVHYIPVHYHPYYQDLELSRRPYPEAERYYSEALTLPLFYGLTDVDQKYVIEELGSLLR